MEMTGREISLFEANRQRFKEHIARTYPSLKQFKYLTSKNEITKYIPLDDINRLLWHYKLFDEICKKPSDKKKYPKLEIKNIERILKSLKRINWLQRTDDSEMVSLIKEKFINSPEGIKYEQEQTKLRVINRHGGRWPDYALYFLIYFLVEYMKEATGKPNYEIIDVLITAQTNHKTLDYIKIQKKYEHISRNTNRLWIVFNVLHDIYFKDYFEKLFVYKDFRPELNADLIEYCLPEFIAFYPPKKKQFLTGNQTKPPLKK